MRKHETTTLSYDVDLLRDLALLLAAEQRSPPEPLPLDLPTLAKQIGATEFEVRQALEDLRDLNLIDGPGTFANVWLFRRITKRGMTFLNAVFDKNKWEKIKKYYEETH